VQSVPRWARAAPPGTPGEARGQGAASPGSAAGGRRDSPGEAEAEAMHCLAAARLGMLAPTDDQEQDEGPKSLASLIDSIGMFGDSLRPNSRGPLIERVVHSLHFKVACIVVIVANTLHVGLAADHRVKNSFRRIEGLPPEPESQIVDILFTAWFAVELLLRIAADGWAFFRGEEGKWNCLDVFLVLNSVVDVVFPLVANLSFLRILRAFRVIHVVRVVRTVKALKSLRTMIFALLKSFMCLMWAFVMILLIVFVFSIVFNSAIAGYFDYLDVANESEVADALRVHASFGSLYETMVSLLCAITGGYDWMNYGKLLRLLEHGELYFVVFCFYVVFCLIGVLNVVTGIFVDSAVSTRTEDEIVECFTDDQRRISREVRRIFKEADVDNSNTLCFAELVKHLGNPWVKAYFSGLNIDPSEAGIIFTLFDKDGSDSVSIDEFVDGTMKLQGHAKSIDVLALMFDQVRFLTRFTSLCGFIEEHVRDIKGVVAPGSPPVGSVFTGSDSVKQLANSNRFARLRTKSRMGTGGGVSAAPTAVVPTAR